MLLLLAAARSHRLWQDLWAGKPLVWMFLSAIVVILAISIYEKRRWR
jgi:hypothetical protein